MFKKGDVFIATLGSIKDTHVQRGTRPVVVYQDGSVNERGETIIVIPCSSNPKKCGLSTHYTLPTTCNLRDDPTTVLCEHMMVVDKSVLVKRIDTLSNEVMKNIDEVVLKLFHIEREEEI